MPWVNGVWVGDMEGLDLEGLSQEDATAAYEDAQSDPEHWMYTGHARTGSAPPRTEPDLDAVHPVTGLTSAEASRLMREGQALDPRTERPLHIRFGPGQHQYDYSKVAFDLDNPDPGGGGGPSADMRTAFYRALRQAGMGGELIDDLWLWAVRKVTEDPTMTAERLLIEMYDSEAFQKRFGGIKALTDKGEGIRNLPTPGEYIRFEKDVAAELTRVGVLYEGADFDTLITNLYLNGVGLTETTERLNAAEKAMHNVPSAVRDKLTSWFGGVYGDSITMKTFLDPADDWSQIQDDISTAETGGWGRMVAGLSEGWSEATARRVADLGLGQAEEWKRFAELKTQEMLYTETLDEAVDIDYETQGVEAVFDLLSEEEGAGLTGYELSDLISKRRGRRTARFSGGGGAILSGTTTGFGAANA